MVPGTPICIIASVSLPIPLSSATSSKGFNLSKNCSTLAAVSVPAPKSINSAPRDTTPSGIFIIPDIIPAAAAVYQEVSLSCSAEFSGTNAI